MKEEVDDDSSTVHPVRPIGARKHYITIAEENGSLVISPKELQVCCGDIVHWTMANTVTATLDFPQHPFGLKYVISPFGLSMEVEEKLSARHEKREYPYKVTTDKGLVRHDPVIIVDPMP